METSPYATPQSDLNLSDQAAPAYVGFWARVGASLIDTIMIMIITVPLLLAVYGGQYFASTEMLLGPWDFLISYVLPAVLVIAFWCYRSATPGKMAIGAKIIDARTGDTPSTTQYVIRYFGYFVSTIVFMLGLIWVAFDKRKQGWHDKMAGTVVVKSASV